MKNAKRVLALLLCLCMVLSYVPAHAHAAGGAANASMVVSATEVNVGDTITVSVSYSDMKISSFACTVLFDKDLLNCESVVGPYASMGAEYERFFFVTKANVPAMMATVQTDTVSTAAEANAIGQVGFTLVGTTDVAYAGQEIFTVTFTAMAAGTVDLTLVEDSSGTDGYKNTVTTRTITITDPNSETTAPYEPTGFFCDHSTTKLVANDNGTHNVVCAEADCGAVVDENVTCTGTDDGDHTTAVTCECGNTVTAGIAHKDEAPKDHVCDVDGCTHAMGEHKSNAQHACQDGICEYCGQSFAASANHADGDDENHNCDVCGEPNIEGHTAGEPVVTENPASCTEEGSVTTETFCTECGAKLSSETESIPAGTGCVLGDPEYTWSGDYSSCTAEVKCQHGTVHKKEEVTTTSAVTTVADCQTAEVVTYTADFTSDWAEDQEKDVTGDTNRNKHVGTPTVSYRQNGNSTHSEIFTYECGHSDWGDTTSCTHDHYEGDAKSHMSVCFCGQALLRVPHEANENGFCVCGMFAAFVDFNGGNISTEPPVPGMSDDQWAEVVESMLGGFDATKLSTFTQDVTSIPVDDFLRMYGQMIVKEGYKLVGIAYDAEGTLPYDGEDITAPTTLYLVWESLHTCAPDHYDYIDYESHKILCVCGETLGVEEHELGEDGSCVCGAIELTVDFTFADFEGNDEPIEDSDLRYFWVMPDQDLILNVYPTNGYDYVDYYIADWGDESEDAPYEVGIVDDQFKVSSDWYDAEDLFISVDGVSRQTIDLNGGSVVNPDDWGEAYDPEENVIFHYGNESTSWKLSWYTEESEEIVREGYKLIGFMRDGEFHDVDEWIEGKAGEETITLVWEELHKHKDYDYDYIDSESHEIFCDCGETLGVVEHEHGEDGSCVCGAFLVTMDYNGGADLLNPGEPSDSWYTMKHTLEWSDDACKDVYTKEGYVFAGFASDAAGENLLPYGTVFQSSTTFYVAWECNHDEAFHKYSYIDNNDGTHTVKCECGEILDDAESHNFDNEAHKCLCEKVEEFTLTVWVLATGDEVELTVPYGANLLEVLAAAEAADEILAIGDQIRRNDKWYNGYNHTIGYSYWDEKAGVWIYDLEGMTMPAADIEVDQDQEFYNGWSFNYDGNNEYVGAEFLSEEGYLTGWNYIEEDFDGVDGGAWYYFYEGTGVWEGYYFRAEGLTRVPYPTEEINGITYAPDADAVASDPNFIDATEAWFMFGDDGKFQYDAQGIVGNSKLVNGMLAWHPGLVKIHGSPFYHYFLGNEEIGGNIGADGDVWVTRIAEGLDREFVLGGIYTFEDSKLCEYTGITEVGGKLRFYGSEGADENRLMIGNGLTKVGENFIYVRSNGELVVNADYYVPTNDKGVVPGTYHFDENGFMVNPELTEKNGIVEENGALYFYENGKIAYNKGLIEFGGGVIYVRSNGQLAVGEYYITNVANYNGSDIESGDKLTFGDDGFMIQPKNGIVDGKYYIDNQIAYNAGVVEVEPGKYIYVRSNGEVVMDREYWITNVGNSGVVAKNYSFDENGYFVPEMAEDALNGIHNGYYYENGKIVYGAGLIEYNGGHIYVRSNGQVAIGKYWVTNTNGLMESNYYVFGEDGMMQ